MAGSDPTGVKPNAFVEANGVARELIERRFRLSPRTIGLFAVFGVFVPTLIYRGAVKDFVRVSTRRDATRLVSLFVSSLRSRAVRARETRERRRARAQPSTPPTSRPEPDRLTDRRARSRRRMRTTSDTDDLGKSFSDRLARRPTRARGGGCISNE
jgi:hypothetical protein